MLAVLEVILVVELHEYFLLQNECVGEVALSPPLLVARPPLSCEDVLLLLLEIDVVVTVLLVGVAGVRVILL